MGQGRGRLSQVLWQNGRFERTTLLDHLDRPHGIALGADGWVYIGEASRIIRINPQSPQRHTASGHRPTAR